jgi:hypothetical protein
MKILLIILLATICAVGQTETLTNAQVIDLSKAGLPTSIIVQKIKDSDGNFDTSVKALIELKSAGVDPEIIALMLERFRKTPSAALNTDPQGFSDSVPLSTPAPADNRDSRTVAIEKSTINPSRQALEKELMKRPEWNRLKLSIVRYKEGADYFVEIGFVPLSVVTHRYTFRVYDRRSGTVIAAGETTSWGSLAKNLARGIAKSLDKSLVK